MSTSRSSQYLSFVGFGAVVFSLVLLLQRKSLFATDNLSIVIQCAAFLLMIWARIAFGWRSFHATAGPTRGGLVTSGPYRYIRHPIYAAVLYFIWTGVFTHLSYITVFLGVLACGGIAMRIVAEEKLVIIQYPEYAAYAARTKRIIPFII